jgi:hypothetical protein
LPIKGVVSQINPFRGLVVPSFSPQRVQPKKDHEQEKREKGRHQDEEKEKTPVEGEDGVGHVDLKA